MRLATERFGWGWLFTARCWRCGETEIKTATGEEPIVIDGHEMSREDLEQLAQRLLRERGWTTGPRGGAVCRRCRQERTGG